MMGEITGRKVLLFCVAAFGTIITVNLTLAWQAVKTFPGIEVANSYVASQEFDDRRSAQLALGWNVAADYDAAAGEIVLTIDGADGAPALDVASVAALVGRATTTRDDFTAAFERTRAGAYVAPAELGRGNWNVRLRATAQDGTEFIQRIPLQVARQG